MSQAILEAMGFGLPLVVTDVGGNPSLVGGRDGCGLVLPHRDPVGWAQSLVELATNVDQRQRFSQQGMARHDRDYSLTRMVDRYTRIYLSLCRAGQQGVSSAAP
jgi:glycosyltransferase involved in cell wall biosynthesis